MSPRHPLAPAAAILAGVALVLTSPSAVRARAADSPQAGAAPGASASDNAAASAASQAVPTTGGARFALLVEGASGGGEYQTMHRGWLDSLATVLRDTFKYDEAHLVILAETPKAGEGRATADGVREALARLAAAVAPAGQLVVVFIGHGTSDASGGKFNLVGPDLTMADWAALLKPIRGHLAVVDTTSASFPFVAGLAAPDRVIIAATSSPAQRFHTVFPEGFVHALTDQAADLDTNGRISLLEAFTYASNTVKQHYEQTGTMATETAVLDDDGDGKGMLAGATGASDGSVAGVTYLDTPAVATSSDPEVQRLLTRQQALTAQIDDLRRRRAAMPADEYTRELDRLLTELATVSSQIRQKTDQ
jgi:hypothetical protein